MRKKTNTSNSILYTVNTSSYLHDAIPVVARGDLKQGKESHAKVLKSSVTTHTLAWVVRITY